MVNLDELQQRAHSYLESTHPLEQTWVEIDAKDVLLIIARIRELEALLDPLGKYVTIEMRKHAAQVKKDCIDG